jgi:hypothetical protein
MRSKLSIKLVNVCIEDGICHEKVQFSMYVSSGHPLTPSAAAHLNDDDAAEQLDSELRVFFQLQLWLLLLLPSC